MSKPATLPRKLKSVGMPCALHIGANVDERRNGERGEAGDEQDLQQGGARLRIIPEPKPTMRRSRRAFAKAHKRRPCPALAQLLSDRRRILKPAVGPQRIDAALDLEARAFAEIAVEHFAVIADQLDDAIGPVGAKAKPLAVIAFKAEQAP